MLVYVQHNSYWKCFYSKSVSNYESSLEIRLCGYGASKAEAYAAYKEALLAAKAVINSVEKSTEFKEGEQ